ncbi:ABC transporter ATP-binding protein [Leucobacter allii]|uniref:ABC transporter ATP-binding protein n=1 Tax=Leucobacter allii TaxID=2932247 RepID=A0ABY4FQL9_9MICO|nr:ABC transporter ATP-binding protein [Leucobacter allii]UOQ58479.1 ABC transporter ATP-binding protein [Leucobacter allii]UOR03061.1 ABC transporter ATP-binding protein [Leucobacter allii]
MVTVLRLTDVTSVRDGRPILDGITWSVEDSERWVILGPNGAGKTTLMKLATASDFPTGGRVEVLGKRLGAVDVFELRNRIGFVSSASERRIPRSETVRDVVLTAAYAVEGRWNEQYDDTDVRQAERILAEWDLGGFADHAYGTLSDGERKRALIARAVMTDPEMLLLDEPSASLDLGARERLLQMLSGFARSSHSPAMIMVTHHVEEVPPGFTHALLLREGRIQAAGPIAETLTAEHLEETFGMPFDLAVHEGRYSAVARPERQASGPGRDI